MQANRKIHLCLRKGTHLHAVPQQSTQNTTNLGLQTYKKNQWTFLVIHTGVDFWARINFANLGLLAKGSIHVQSIIP